MAPGQPDSKRPRLNNGPPSWSVGGSQSNLSLLHPIPSPTNVHHVPHTPTAQPLNSHAGPYQQPPYSPHAFPRSIEQAPLPPPPIHQQQPHHLQQQQQAPPPPPPPPPMHSQPPSVSQYPSHLEDRRHHEPDRFPPMQEHRQHPASPASMPYAAYPPRDPIVKADPEEPVPHLHRSQSTGTAPDSAPPSHVHSSLPAQAFAAEKRHMSFDGAPPSSSLYGRQPSYPPPTPGPQAQSYDYGSPYGHGSSDMQFTIPISSTGKRKAQRASQACDNCRALKAKCDELKPCKSCKEKKVECVYRETAPKQQDKFATEILEHLVLMRSDLANINQRISNLEHQNERRQSTTSESRGRLKRESPVAQFPPEQSLGNGDHNGLAASPAQIGGDCRSPETVAAGPEPLTIGEAQPQGQTMRPVDEDREDEPGPPVRPGNPAIPLGHTTLAALLLKWRSIESLVRPSLDVVGLKFIDEFPIRQEEKRGLLRVWGRGEGQDNILDRDGIQDHGILEMMDEYSETGASSPAATSPADCWGVIGGSPAASAERRSIPPTPAPALDLSADIVWKYVKSYDLNIQNMHPLLVPLNLREMVNSFLSQVHGKLRGGSTGLPGRYVSVPPPHQEAGFKRKRSPGPDGFEPLPMRRLGFQRSITNAVVLMVLALGKICLVNDRKIPNVVPVTDMGHSSPLIRNGHTASPSQSSPPSYASHSHSAGFPSPKDTFERVATAASRRASLQGGATSMPPRSTAPFRRNMDVIPGLDYCGYALDIVGSQWGGRSLSHVHFHILAGLYYGQLGRVMDSYAHIKEAGFALHSNMRRKFDRFRRLKDQVTEVTDDTDNQILYAFWTCLQLESDIIAELPLPQSPIMAYEDIIPHPNGTLARHYGFSEVVLQSYLGQLFLRKRLNEIHKTIYDPDNKEIYPEPNSEFQVNARSMEIVRGLEEALIHERIIPPAFKFDPGEPPAKEILAARLRAKYWGAQVITYRPFVRMVLESNFDAAVSSSPLPETHVVATPRWPPEFSDAVVEFAAKGVKALTESTRAFHGLEEARFIVTNVFGTAHAQWGNLLTLAAAFRDPTLNRYIREDTLQLLFRKTINFFGMIAQPSSGLAVDMRILEMLERELWPNLSFEIGDIRVGSSFSSSASHLGRRGPTTPSASNLTNEHIPGTPVNNIGGLVSQ